MRYVKARIRNEELAKAYRIYVTDALKVLSENTAKQAGGSILKNRFADLLKPQPKTTRSSEEVIDTIRNKLTKLEG